MVASNKGPHRRRRRSAVDRLAAGGVDRCQAAPQQRRRTRRRPMSGRPAAAPPRRRAIDVLPPPQLRRRPRQSGGVDAMHRSRRAPRTRTALCASSRGLDASHSPLHLLGAASLPSPPPSPFPCTHEAPTHFIIVQDRARRRAPFKAPARVAVTRAGERGKIARERELWVDRSARAGRLVARLVLLELSSARASSVGLRPRRCATSCRSIDRCAASAASLEPDCAVESALHSLSPQADERDRVAADQMADAREPSGARARKSGDA